LSYGKDPVRIEDYHLEGELIYNGELIVDQDTTPEEIKNFLFGVDPR
jgi:hypothetical protein